MNSPTLLPLGVFGLGGTELIVILVILLVLFGGSKLPSLARGLGQSIKEFKKSSKDEEEDAEKKIVATPAENPSKPTPVSKHPGAN
jgi:sec-independent protein translocase protein TatA